MNRFYKILRSVILTLIGLAVFVPAALYVLLSLPPVQRWLCHKAESELSQLLTVPVHIDAVQISPFNRVTLHGVRVEDGRGVDALKVRRLGAGINLWDYMAHDRIVLSYAELIDMDARLYRDTIGAPLNIQPIIDALSKKDENKPPTKFDFRINNVVIRTSSVAYDILSEERRETGFDPNHIAVSEFSADLRLPRMANDDFTAELRRLTLREQSGFTLDNLSGLFHVTALGSQVHNLLVELPGTRLAFADFRFDYSGWDSLKTEWPTMPLDICLLENSRISTSDFTAFMPVLEGLDMTFDTHLALRGTVRDIELTDMRMVSNQGAELTAEARVTGLADSTAMLSWELPKLEAAFNGPRAVATALHFIPLHSDLRTVVSNLGDIRLKVTSEGNRREASLTAMVTSDLGKIDLEGSLRLPEGSKPSSTGVVEITDFALGQLFAGTDKPLADFGSLTASIDYNVTLPRRGTFPSGEASVNIAQMAYRQHEFYDLVADVSSDGRSLTASASVDNPGLAILEASAEASLDSGLFALNAGVSASDINLSAFSEAKMLAGRRLGFDLTADISGHSVDDAEGEVAISDLTFLDAEEQGARIGSITLSSIRGAESDSILIRSDIIDGCMTGKYHLSTLAPAFRALLAQIVPALDHTGSVVAQDYWSKADNFNRFDYQLTLKTLDPLGDMVRLPVKVINPIDIAGEMNTERRSMSASLDAPYLQQGNKLIERTRIDASVDGPTDEDPQSRGSFFFTTALPTKKGEMVLETHAEAVDNQVDARVNWKVDRQRDFSGAINTTVRFDRRPPGNLDTEILINPSRLVFNDTVWTVDPARITVEGKTIDVRDFKVWRGDQYVAMSGRASESPLDTITLSLHDVNLDYVFETLDIPTAMFGGNASGSIYATEVLTPNPTAFTPGLSVRNLTYNYSLMGDGLIRAAWIPQTKAVNIVAEISQPNGRKSYVDGNIYPMDESLDISFDADRIECGFLLPYMSAFASDVSGYASGKARLYGTFKLIDMVGDVYGEDVKLKLAFTNTSYTTTDSVKLRPGRIDLEGLVIKDDAGHTAMLNGRVTHECFKNPRFDFRITDARDLLVYDVKENPEHPWYGKIYGNGGATVKGEPGVVDIQVDMTTAAGSAFTYVLSDALNAVEYNFITFRDRDQAYKDSIAALSAPPPIVQELRKKMMAQQQASSSTYRMTFNVDITPQALITLVMDPVGGDKIKAYGHGILSMAYDSSSEDLRMNGTYTVERGSYNFTLQDIIIKDFTINDGSTIAFLGDPYSAQLDITARYQVRGANLTDLDESFLEDKELNRTNVPVNALLKVNGDMRQPDIGFDLDFPSLTEETKRKVRSIINTEEMMNRQIIYLLALNRFYTPDYMNATRGNEFVSVASSTISSQLSNMLGQLSDSWNIAPNFRSSRGDFSDVEVDVALSSHLLNNRLLLNGNLGYRDNSLNNNSFIGDFDLEYLINRSGSLRLKAYNRYNDQNYYLKSALTTQGVGIVYKKDFDNFSDIFRHWRRRKPTKETPAPAKETAVPVDTLFSVPDTVD